MEVLVLGGTQFVGRHIMATLHAGGHRVCVFNRGVTTDELPESVERLRGDRDEGAAGLAALRGRRWDACVDVSGLTARQVRASAEMLRECVGRYLFVSAVSVYGDPTERPVRETHARVAPASEDVTELDGETYGRLKVTSENIVQGIYRERCTLLRPQIVAGPHDPYDRYSYWVRRAAQGGEMPAPGDGSDHVQVIDARDMAQFVRTVIEGDVGGAFNLAGPRLTWVEFLRVLGGRELVWVPAKVIRAAGVTEFELPLFREEHGPRSGLMDVCSERAREVGLVLTPPEETARWASEWVRGARLEPAFSSEREAELIRMARSNRISPAEADRSRASSRV